VGLVPGLMREGRAGTCRRVLSTSVGFGGLDAALVVGSVQAGDVGIARREA
jgi:3-oxoacyl-(acyl-carrier-protein) synthase